MTSMLDDIRTLVTPSWLSRASAQTDESEAAISKSLAAVLPAILMATAKRVDHPGFMAHLASFATGVSDVDGAARADPPSPSPTVGDAGASLLTNLFGGSLTGIGDAVARFAGIRGTSAISLLSLASPLVFGYLGRMMRSEHLDAAGLADRLRRERRSLAESLPAGFEMPAFLRTPSETLRDTAAAAQRIDIPSAPAGGARTSTGWVMPLLLTAIAVGALIWWGARDGMIRVPARASDAAASAIGTAGSSARMLVRTLPGNVNLRVPTDSMEDRLVDHLGTRSTGSPGVATWFAFDRIGFDSGSASLTPESREQLGNVAQILRAYPNVRVIIAGFTDNVGDEAANAALSRSRAAAVANALQASGIAMARMQTEGLGGRNPVADNSTEEGRAQNRRVALLVNTLG